MWGNGKCTSPIGQNRCSMDDRGCRWGLFRNLPANRRRAEGSSGSLCLQMEDNPKPVEREQTVTDILHIGRFQRWYTPHFSVFFDMHTHLNTHIDLFDSVSKLQSLVESVDIDSVSWVFLHKRWLWSKSINRNEPYQLRLMWKFCWRRRDQSVRQKQEYKPLHH